MRLRKLSLLQYYYVTSQYTLCHPSIILHYLSQYYGRIAQYLNINKSNAHCGICGKYHCEQIFIVALNNIISILFNFFTTNS